MMRRLNIGLVACAMLAGCATAHGPDVLAAEDAIRFGIEACERHFLEGLHMEEAIAASAHGRAFVPAEKAFEHWTSDPRPWRLAGVHVWVGLTDDADDADECRVLALDIGGSLLRDAIMREHVGRPDRTWTAWSTGGGGRRAVCTTDRVPEGKSLLVVAGHTVNTHMPEVVSAPIPARFDVTVFNRATCERNS